MKMTTGQIVEKVLINIIEEGISFAETMADLYINNIEMDITVMELYPVAESALIDCMREQFILDEETLEDNKKTLRLIVRDEEKIAKIMNDLMGTYN